MNLEPSKSSRIDYLNFSSPFGLCVAGKCNDFVEVLTELSVARSFGGVSFKKCKT
jgi:hypothetical protein